MAKIKATLTLTVHYEDESNEMTLDEMSQEAVHNLKQLCDHAAGNGSMSLESPMTVEDWDCEVAVSKKPD
jgi:hypothetical protein